MSAWHLRAHSPASSSQTTVGQDWQSQPALYLLHTPVTLKHSQGHQKRYESVNPASKIYNYAKFKWPHSNPFPVFRLSSDVTDGVFLLFTGCWICSLNSSFSQIVVQNKFSKPVLLISFTFSPRVFLKWNSIRNVKFLAVKGLNILLPPKRSNCSSIHQSPKHISYHP